MTYDSNVTIINPSSQNSELVCPRCASTYLHHGAVTNYDRSEDEETVTKAVVNGKDVSITAGAPNDGNPSSRRHGLVIAFSCEACGDGLELTVAQHKGMTLMGWRYESTTL